MAYTVYTIEVKSYMTKKSEGDFDFMKKFNEDNPMPYRKSMKSLLMRGKEKST